MKGLIVRSPWIERILSGQKTWEIRGTHTKIRGPIALIKSGSGMVYGEIQITGSKELTLEDYQSSQEYHTIDQAHTRELPYKKTYAWMMEKPELYEEPIPYEHPKGAVIWVNLT
ncbi:ASCH domain-containing protein [Halobacillus fulvus]|nr:ASCH domain-containing protein [Halobacillus fulvus]